MASGSASRTKGRANNAQLSERRTSKRERASAGARKAVKVSAHSTQSAAARASAAGRAAAAVPPAADGEKKQASIATRKSACRLVQNNEQHFWIRMEQPRGTQGEGWWRREVEWGVGASRTLPCCLAYLYQFPRWSASEYASRGARVRRRASLVRVCHRPRGRERIPALTTYEALNRYRSQCSRTAPAWRGGSCASLPSRRSSASSDATQRS